MRTMRQWWQALQDSGAVWQHPGDPRAPHVVLRSGRHSDGFIDTLQFLSKIDNLVPAAQELSSIMRDFGVGREELDWIFGSPMAGIPIATAVAQFIGAKNIGFTEKKGDKELICRFDLEPGATVALIEEMTTSGGTPQRGIDAILAKNPEASISLVVGAFLIRCNANPEELKPFFLAPVVHLPALGVSFGEWEPSECPLCESGSRAISNCKQVWRDLLMTMGNPDHPLKQATVPFEQK